MLDDKQNLQRYLKSNGFFLYYQGYHRVKGTAPYTKHSCKKD